MSSSDHLEAHAGLLAVAAGRAVPRGPRSSARQSATVVPGPARSSAPPAAGGKSRSPSPQSSTRRSTARPGTARAAAAAGRTTVPACGVPSAVPMPKTPSPPRSWPTHWLSPRKSPSLGCRRLPGCVWTTPRMVSRRSAWRTMRLRQRLGVAVEPDVGHAGVALGPGRQRGQHDGLVGLAQAEQHPAGFLLAAAPRRGGRRIPRTACGRRRRSAACAPAADTSARHRSSQSARPGALAEERPVQAVKELTGSADQSLQHGPRRLLQGRLRGIKGR